MNGKIYKLGDFLIRQKLPIDILDDILYKRLTIKLYGKGVSLRDSEIGKNIGTKKQFTIKKGQFILSKIDARNGAFGIIPEECDNGIITGNFWSYEINKNIINIDWLNLYVSTDDFISICTSSSSGATNRKYLDEKIFLNHELFVPNIEEQEKQIKIYFNTKTNFDIFSKINNKNLSYIKQLKQAILQDAIKGKLTKTWRENNPNIESASVLLEKIQKEKEELVKQKKLKKQEKLKEISEDEIPFEIPENWSWCRLGEIIHLTSGNFLSSSQMNKNGNIPVFGGNGINGYHNEYNTEEETIVIGRVGFYCGSIHLTPEKAWITDNAFFTIFNPNYIYRNFLIRLLKGTNLKEKENAGAQPVISGTKVYPIPIPLPPLEEQKEIVKNVDEMMMLCDELEKQSLETKENSENLMKSVLSEVFSS